MQFLDHSDNRDAWETLAWPQMIEAMTLIANIRRQAIAAGRPDVQQGISRIGVELQDRLDKLAVSTAVKADEAIRRKLREGQRRPLTQRPVHLSDVIRSVPFGRGLGAVKVGLIDELNRAVNPGGYGPYWRAIEEGSAEVGNQMVGRVLYGTFTGGSGDPERPRYQYRRDVLGSQAAPHSDFEWGGEDPGKGVIHTEIEGRHFLKRGTDEAWAFYVREVQAIDTNVSRQILALMA